VYQKKKEKDEFDLNEPQPEKESEMKLQTHQGKVAIYIIFSEGKRAII
jgi:hypothetical protein